MEKNGYFIVIALIHALIVLFTLPSAQADPAIGNRFGDIPKIIPGLSLSTDLPDPKDRVTSMPGTKIEAREQVVREPQLAGERELFSRQVQERLQGPAPFPPPAEPAGEPLSESRRLLPDQVLDSQVRERLQGPAPFLPPAEPAGEPLPESRRLLPDQVLKLLDSSDRQEWR